ncbi:MAG: alpha/beta hydrolase [Actinobacteria bacterium]|nr:alpha/beta hydrolase [Actinomycetota bacterium]
MDAVGQWERAGSYHEVAGDRVFVVDRAAEREELEPALVLHGFPTCSYDWRGALETLARRRRVVIPDYPGFGLSAKPDRRYSLFEQADVVAAVVAELGLAEVALVTHDLGDSVGAELLARSLDGDLAWEVSRRVITNGSIYMELVQLSDGQQLLLALPDEMLSEELAPDRGAIAAALRGTLAPDASVDDAELDALGQLVVHDGGSRLLPRTIRYIEERRRHESRWYGAIERHASPLTIVWGDADPIAVWPMAERLHAARPDATLVRLEGIGHYPMLEAPDAFNAALEHALG